MAILRSHGVLYVDAIPTHTPTSEQAKLARLEDTLTFYYYNGAAWITIDIDALAAVAGVQSVTGTAVDNTDVLNPIVNLQTAAQTSIADVGGNYTGTDVEAALAEVATQFSGLAHTAITGINLIATANPNEYSVEITWDDADGNPQTTTDPTPITISGVTDLGYTASPTDGTVTSSNGDDATLPLATLVNAGLLSPAEKAILSFITVTQAVDLDAMEAAIATAMQTVTDTNSIDLTKSGTALSADLKLSATQTGATVSIEADGLRVVVDAEVEPTGYLSRAAAIIALGTGAKFQYLAANLDGAVEGTVAWT